MARYRVLGSALAILLVYAPLASAEGTNEVTIINCGSIRNFNTSYQYGSYSWLEYIVETTRDVNICPYAVSVEAWVVGHPGGSLSSTWDLFTASVRRPVLLPYYGRWITAGKHWRILLGLYYSNGSTSSVANVRAPAADAAYMCSLQGADYYWDGFECVYTPGSPIIVDTARNGYHLTNVDEGVLFDLDADGTPESVSWTRPDSDDAFLAMDRNGNGRIDDGSELFGNRTPAADDAEAMTLNGFEALRLLHGPSHGPSTLDQHIDRGDSAFARLLLWRDANHNGLSEPEELTPAGAVIAAIGTDYKQKKRVDRFGNQFRQQGRLTWTTGEESTVYDVWLQRRQ
jgi:hypothetical protein